MSEIKTQIIHSERGISSKDLVVRNYSKQLKSAVISDMRRKEILKKMRSELTAQQFHRPEIRSVEAVARRESISENNSEITHSGDSLQTSVNNDFIHTGRHTDYIKNARISYSEDVKAVIAASEKIDKNEQLLGRNIRLKIILRNMQKRQMRLKNKRYIVARNDTDNSFALESAEAVRSATDTIVEAASIFRGAVKGTANSIETVKDIALNGVKIGTEKDVGKIFTAVGGGIKNVASNAGNQLLKTKIDKSKITDTGTETIKQGITEIRYIDNARKAVLNTARTTVKAAVAVKNMPHDTRVKIRKIKKNVRRIKEATVKGIEVARKVLTSKAGLIILLALAVILLMTVLINGLVTAVSAIITSVFRWLVSENGDKSSEEILDGYSTSIVQYVEEKQSEINEIVEGFVCDKRQYPPYDEISELNQYGNKDIGDTDKNAVIAILAVLRYRDLQDNNNGDEKEIKFEFTDDEIQDVVEKFYDFEYHI